MNLYKINLLDGGTLFFDWREVQSMEFRPDRFEHGRQQPITVIIHLKNCISYEVSGDQLDVLWNVWRAQADSPESEKQLAPNPSTILRTIS